MTCERSSHRNFEDTFMIFLRRTQWNNTFKYLYYPILRISFWLWISLVAHFKYIITFISIDNISKDKGEKKIYQCTNLSCQLKGCQVINYHLFCAFNIRVKKKYVIAQSSSHSCFRYRCWLHKLLPVTQYSYVVLHDKKLIKHTNVL